MSHLDRAIEVFNIELEELNSALVRLKKNEEFDSLIDFLCQENIRVIVIGMGKSGHVGSKISASLASTGTFSFFLHPAEAYHGDLGMIGKKDCILFLSNSGETEEILRLLPFVKKNGNNIISIVGNLDSTLAKNSDWIIDASVDKEACPINLAPTSSSTLSLILGDCLTLALMTAKNFKQEDFAKLHPGGNIGRRLLTTAKDHIIPIASLVCKGNSSFEDLLSLISSGGQGLVLVQAGEGFGIITDGDLRRCLQKSGRASFEKTAEDIMTSDPISIDINASYHEIEKLIVEHSISTLLVKDKNQIVGVVRANSLLS
jgi:arabinose-5-phosphate isomerase